MNTLTYNAIALLVGALMFVPMSPSTVRADDDDDWEDRWEEFDDDWDDDDRWERRRWHRHYPYDGYRVYHYPSPRYYRYYRGPATRYYYPDGRRVDHYYEPYPRYYYGGRVHAGPVDVYYGRHGAVRVGPIHVYW
jgi:hypothetical protein